MTSLTLRLTQVAKTTIVLPFLLAVLLGFGFHANATNTHIAHTVISANYNHAVADVDDLPPGH